MTRARTRSIGSLTDVIWSEQDVRCAPVPPIIKPSKRERRIPGRGRRQPPPQVARLNTRSAARPFRKPAAAAAAAAGDRRSAGSFSHAHDLILFVIGGSRNSTPLKWASSRGQVDDASHERESNGNNNNNNAHSSSRRRLRLRAARVIRKRHCRPLRRSRLLETDSRDC